MIEAILEIQRKISRGEKSASQLADEASSAMRSRPVHDPQTELLDPIREEIRARGAM